MLHTIQVYFEGGGGELLGPSHAGLLGYKLWNGRETETRVLTKIERVNQQIRVCSIPIALTLIVSLSLLRGHCATAGHEAHACIMHLCKAHVATIHRDTSPRQTWLACPIVHNSGSGFQSHFEQQA